MSAQLQSVRVCVIKDEHSQICDLSMNFRCEASGSPEWLSEQTVKPLGLM